MSTRLSIRRSSPLLAVLFAFPLLALALPAQAQMGSQQISGAITDLATKLGQEEQANLEIIKKTIEASTDKYATALNELNKARLRRSMTPALNSNVMISLLGVPAASAYTSMLANTGLEGRYRELNLIKPNKEGVALGEGLIDSTEGSLSSDKSNFKVFMEYFCDPRADSGQMGLIGIGNDPIYNIRDIESGYQYSCGNKRVQALGSVSVAELVEESSDKAKQHNQIIGLPLKPHILFFEPTTFPSNRSTAAIAGDEVTNVNPLAPLVYAGYRYFERLVLGKPADKNALAHLKDAGGREAYVREQARIARQMVASYPFAMLFAERVGMMAKDPKMAERCAALSHPALRRECNKSPPEAAADLLLSSMDGVSSDPTLLAIARSLRSQPTMSMAQYMDILMYKMPMSPGYIKRINTLSPSQLQREKVFLSSLQVVLKYQINRWSEVALAIEALQK